MPPAQVFLSYRRSDTAAVAHAVVLVGGASVPRTADLPADLRWIAERNASRLSLDTLGQDIDALVEAVPRLAATPRSFRVLWVDDHPANNEWERRHLRPEGILFDNVVSTVEAIEQLRFSRYDLVITDLGRLGSSDRSRAAGSDLLGHPVITEGGPPVIVYGGRTAVAQSDALRSRGAFGVADSWEGLHELVRRALNRPEA